MTEHSFVYTAALTRHPETSDQIIRGIAVHVSWIQENVLTLMYTLTGDCARLCIPEARPPAQVDGLWRHTCFEAFFSVEGESAYLELNFSPSGEWAAYHFRGYRELSLLAEEEPRPQITTWRTEQSFVLDARMQLPQPLTIQPLRLGLSAVVEDDRGQLSYWALKHPPGKPDFHHAEAFALRIEPRQSRKGQQP